MLAAVIPRLEAGTSYDKYSDTYMMRMLAGIRLMNTEHPLVSHIVTYVLSILPTLAGNTSSLNLARMFHVFRTLGVKTKETRELLSQLTNILEANQSLPFTAKELRLIMSGLSALPPDCAKETGRILDSVYAILASSEKKLVFTSNEISFFLSGFSQMTGEYSLNMFDRMSE